MKITRSQLKRLIKEEMNRINEAETVAGDEVAGAYALEGMSVDEVVKAFERLVKRRGDNHGLVIEGLGALRAAHFTAKTRAQHQGDTARGLGVAISIGHHEPVTSSDGSYTDSTDRTAWATARLQDKEQTSDKLKAAVAKFNSQNGGKGGQVRQGENVHFHWTASDNETPFPQGGPTVWL